VVIKCPEKSKNRGPSQGSRNNAALDAISYIHIRAKNRLADLAPRIPRVKQKWWINWGARAGGQRRGGSVAVRDPSNLETVPQNHRVSVLRVTVLALPGTAASLPL